MKGMLHSLGLAACFSAATTFGQIDWTSVRSPTSQSLARVTWTHGQLLAFTGRDTLLTSQDGIAWTPSWTNCHLSAVTWAGDRYVAVGDRPFEDLHRHTTGSVFSSSDGRSWTVLDDSPNPYSVYLNDIVWADSQFVAVGEPSIILTSPDGVNWTPRTPIPNVTGSFSSVEWTGSQLVVVGVDQGIGVDRSAVLTSPDGVKWETRNTGGKSALTDVVWTGHQWVAVGVNGAILTSPDGFTWTSRNSGTDSRLVAVVWTGHQLVAIGGSLSDQPVVLSSPDGVTWTDRTPAQFWSCHSLAWTGQRLVAACDDGIILTSPEDPISVRPPGSLNRDITLRMGHGEIRYRLSEFARGTHASATLLALSGESVFSQAMPAGREGRVPVGPLAQGKYLFELQADGKLFSRFFEIFR